MRSAKKRAAKPPVAAGQGRAPWLLLVFVLVAWAVESGRKPKWDWDLLAYSACVEELSGATPEAVHRAVYRELEELAPPEVFEELCHGNEYRERVANDHEAFSAQLPFYRGRILLIGILATLSFIGISPIDGIFTLSLLSGLLLAAVFFLWVSRFRWPGIAALAGISWLMATDWITTLSMASPDALSAALIFAGAYLALQTKHLVPALIVLGLALTARVDHAIFIGPLLVLRYFHPLHGKPLTARALISTLVLYAGVVLLCTKGRGTYGWWTVFHHTFIEYKTDPVAQTPALDLGFWIDRTVRSLPMFKEWRALLTTLVGLAAIGIGFRKLRWKSLGAGLATTALFGVIIHFLIFPALWPRLFLAHWALIGIALFLVAGERTEGRTSARQLQS
jgi:hypothetical protein